MNRQQAKEKIKKLVERYEKLSETEKKKYNEQQTKDHFIRPLFEALGWDFEQEVWPETDVSGKRVDYSFRLGNVTKFFLEAKAIPVNLDEEKWAEQAINYSWHKSVPWVVLSDFEAIKIYNTEWDEPDIQSCQFIEIPYTKYLTDERLWWLSHDAFEKGILDQEAEKVGRKPKRIIDKQLASDLVRWRDLLFKNLEVYNPKIDKREISEYVQRILDRLIFIRTLEDRGIEDVILQPLAREWQEKGKTDELLINLNKVFRKIDRIYNSGLFEEGAYDHLGDKIHAEDQVFVEVINELYKTKGKGIRYKFSDIPADIFGSIYEQYLGHIQLEDHKEDKTSKRKSQGIYYTPRYIVDYIVQNTLGEFLKTRNPTEIKNIKVLDPACGSGSFLISAYQTLIDYWQKQKKHKLKGGDKLEALEKAFKRRNGNLIPSPEKMRILLNNIYGVDLDEEAVEIARLNLLLKMVDRRIKLPKLSSNIQVGNSLISGTEKELKKYFGEDWKEKEPFRWKSKFKEIFSKGGFDVVIGNPPWGATLANEEKKYFKDEYISGKGIIDTFALFLERSGNLLKKDGYLGFVLPDIILLKNYPSIRKHILDNFTILDIIYHGMAFEGVNLNSVTLILKKTTPLKKNIINIIINEEDSDLKTNKIDQSFFNNLEDYKFNIYLTPELISLKDKLNKNFTPLSKIAHAHEGIHSGNVRDKLFIEKKINEKCHELIFGRDEIDRYFLKWNGKWVNYDKNLIDKEKKEYAGLGKKEYFTQPKILVRRTGDTVLATLDKEGYFVSNNLFVLLLNDEYKDRIDLKYLVALSNSKLITFFYRLIQPREKQLFAELKINHIKQFPIVVAGKKEQIKISKLVDQIIISKKELTKLDPILDKRDYENKKVEVKKIDERIDQLVYKLYDLTKKEIEIIENHG